MSKNPFLNALAATGYISIVASLMFYAPKFEDEIVGVLMPIAAISLFTLSAAVMGYIFLAVPAELFLANKKKEAVNLFLSTVGIFAIFTIIAFVLIFVQIS